MKTPKSNNQSNTSNELEPEVKAKAEEIEAQLKDTEIPKGSSKAEEAVKRAQQWFLDMEG